MPLDPTPRFKPDDAAALKAAEEWVPQEHLSRQVQKLLQAGRLGKLLALHADVFFAKGRTGSAKLGMPRQEEYPPCPRSRE